MDDNQTAGLTEAEQVKALQFELQRSNSSLAQSMAICDEMAEMAAGDRREIAALRAELKVRRQAMSGPSPARKPIPGDDDLADPPQAA